MSATPAISAHGRNAMKWISRIWTVPVCSMTLALAGNAVEGEWRWHLSVDQDRASLSLAQTEEGTDNIGSPQFSCGRSSGIKVWGLMDEKMRWAFADLIRSDTYPLAKFLPEAPEASGIIETAYDELREGWTYTIGIHTDTHAFDRFKRTGLLEFKLGTTLISISRTKLGLDKFDQFLNACRRPRQQTKGTRPP
jgi:hypothetical protein